MTGILARSLALLWAVHACFPGIRLVWADSGYAGKLVGWAARQLRLSVQIVAKLAGQTTFVVIRERDQRALAAALIDHRTDLVRLPDSWRSPRRLARHQHT